MSKDKKYINGVRWIPCDLALVQTLSSFSGCPGQVFEGDIDGLPAGIRNGMDGLSDLHISGYMDWQTIESNCLSAGGEFVIGRKDVDQAKHKNYAFAIGVDDDNDLYYTGPFKYFDAHHQSLSAVDVDAAFGQIKFSPPSSGSAYRTNLLRQCSTFSAAPPNPKWPQASAPPEH